MFEGSIVHQTKNNMKNSRRSIIVGLIAGACALLFIKSPALFPGAEWVTKVIFVLICPLSVWGFVLGIRSIHEEGNGVWQWIAVWLNGLLMIGFFLMVIMLMEAIHNFN